MQDPGENGNRSAPATGPAAEVDTNPSQFEIHPRRRISAGTERAEEWTIVTRKRAQRFRSAFPSMYCQKSRSQRDHRDFKHEFFLSFRPREGKPSGARSVA